jgi:hypothetical protein
MTSIAYSLLHIQACTQSVPELPCWFGELTLIIHHMQRQGVLTAIEEQVHFARRRFGRYELIDFVAVLFGYTISGERTLEAFYERVQPWASPFMALFGREGLPSRSALSRFLAALDQAAVEALRTLFLTDLLARPLTKEEQEGGLFDRQGNQYYVFDVDGMREAARQRALPQTADRPPAQRRLRPLCTPGYTGRKRGEVVRSPRSCRPIRISGSPRLETLATASIGPNCARQSQPFNATERPITTPQNGCCCAWMVNMGLERSSPISLVCHS